MCTTKKTSHSDDRIVEISLKTYCSDEFGMTINASEVVSKLESVRNSFKTSDGSSQKFNRKTFSEIYRHVSDEIPMFFSMKELSI